jgi:hypothetical protein
MHPMKILKQCRRRVESKLGNSVIVTRYFRVERCTGFSREVCSVQEMHSRSDGASCCLNPRSKEEYIPYIELQRRW